MVKQRPIRIIAHRSRGYGEEENTLAAFTKALASAVDEIEMDLQLTKDGELVVWHDSFLHTLSGKRVKLCDLTLKEAEENGLMSCRTMLKEFRLRGRGKALNIDIKRYGREERLVKMLRRYHLQKRVLIVSWISRSLERIHALDPALDLSYSFIPKLSSLEGNGLPVRPALFLPSIVKRLPLKTVNLLPRLFPVTRSIVRRLNALGIDVVVCNEDTILGNERLLRIGVCGSMTNAPLLLLKNWK